MRAFGADLNGSRVDIIIIKLALLFYIDPRLGSGAFLRAETPFAQYDFGITN
jgi:hypothetical protein